MKNDHLYNSPLRVAVALLSVLSFAGPAMAREHHQEKVSPPSTDSMDVVGHLVIPVEQLLRSELQSIGSATTLNFKILCTGP